MNMLSTRAIGWRLDRRDGYRIGFTSHDRTVRIDGVDYLPQPALSLTSIRRNGAWEPGGLDIEGALNSDLISENDLMAGRWAQAHICIFSFDWMQPHSAITSLAEANISRIAVEDGVFRTELIERRPTATAAMVPRTSPGCRALFTGQECGLSPARYRHEQIAVASNDYMLTLDNVPQGADFTYGSLRWLAGPNRGLRHGIRAQDGATLRLDKPAFFAADLPQPVELIEGCDHSISTCAVRFSNAVNFRGEPHLPGIDFLTRYPG